MLAVSGKLNPRMFGPGYHDFDYQEEFAGLPLYRGRQAGALAADDLSVRRPHDAVRPIP